uniref:AsIV-cont00169-ORF1 n=1 Tax=Apophua simplicipes ichnovirus TaxID=1329648 RepID=S5DMS4_9VIRU|nr:AsIV-cont00169-ORF1 [Apophua simplicipes ichnovirus]
MATTNDSKRMKELVFKIARYNEYLEKHRDRTVLQHFEKSKMVKIQISKRLLIEELKMLVKNFEQVPKEFSLICYSFQSQVIKTINRYLCRCVNNLILFAADYESSLKRAYVWARLAFGISIIPR